MKKLSPAFQYFLPIIVVVFTWLQLEISVDPYNIPAMELKYILLNLFTLGAIWAVFMLFSNRVWLSCLLMSILGSGVAIINYYVIAFKGAPLSALELRNFTTAMNIVSSYSFKLSLRIFLILILFAISIFLSFGAWYLSKNNSSTQSKQKNYIRTITRILLIVLVFYFGYFSDSPIKPRKIITWSWSSAYSQYGYTACTVETFQSLFNVINKPDGYSSDKVDDLKISTSPKPQTPDIILILNETFYDLNQITQLNEDVDYLNNYHTNSNFYTGTTLSPGRSGGTNSSEYELLTSNSMQLMPGVTPFNVLNLTGANSIVSHLESLNYNTLGCHSGTGKNYYRSVGYPALGFDHSFFGTDFYNLTHYGKRWYETDESVYDQVISWYEGTMQDSPRFAYVLTIQNHGEWNFNDPTLDYVHADTDYGEYDEVIDEYLSCISLSDQAFKDLTDYYAEVDRPVIICMLGDHSPNFADEIADPSYSEDELNLLLRKTPLLIWANYDLGIENRDLGTMSMNYVIPTLLDMAGVSLSPYYQYMLDLKKDVPILTSYGVYYDAEGNMYSYEDETEYSEAVNNYFYLEYNNLSDHRKQELFDAAS